jgi:hypothetical protein
VTGVREAASLKSERAAALAPEVELPDAERTNPDIYAVGHPIYAPKEEAPEVHKPSLASGEVATFAGETRAFRPQTLGELLDATLSL